jgi:hypothetical protein
MKKIFVCSQFQGDSNKNRERAQSYCRVIALRGLLPIAPHAYFTYFLNDDLDKERALGMSFSDALLEMCDGVLVIRMDLFVSDGMDHEIRIAKGCMKPVWECDVNSKISQDQNTCEVNHGIDCLMEIIQRRSER